MYCFFISLALLLVVELLLAVLMCSPTDCISFYSLLTNALMASSRLSINTTATATSV
jgi:hypothetical protein